MLSIDGNPSQFIIANDEVTTVNDIIGSNSHHFEDSKECNMCSMAIWDVRSCRLGSMKDTSKFGNFMKYNNSQDNHICYENTCCASNVQQCCPNNKDQDETYDQRIVLFWDIFYIFLFALLILSFIVHEEMKHIMLEIHHIVSEKQNLILFYITNGKTAEIHPGE